MASSKMVNDRQRSAVIVSEAAETHSAEVGRKLTQIFAVASPAEGDPAPLDWARVVRDLGRSFRVKKDELVAADAAHLAEKADDVEPRERRDRLHESLFKRLSMLRNVLQAIYGDAVVQKLGFAGPTPVEPIALCRLGSVVHTNLPGLADYTPLSPGLSLDTSLHAAELAAEVAGLETALQDLAREAKELDATKVRKDQILVAYDTHFIHGARALEALFTLAGEHELAARVRPSARRPGRTHEDDASDPDAGIEPGLEAGGDTAGDSAGAPAA